ncbi:unnamed protein product, partial [Rotaria sordida]
MANDNQDISNEIFDVLKLKKAILAISSHLPNANDAIVYLYEKTKEREKLIINCCRALSK